MAWDFLTQPAGATRTGDFLIANLQDANWRRFRAAVAFVKRSGTQYIRHHLDRFSRRAEVEIVVGVSLRGTSADGLRDLLDSLGKRGRVWVLHNDNPAKHPTFHPKLYLFSSDVAAKLLVGSGNLTAGGLFTNYEAGIAAQLDLGRSDDRELFDAINAQLDEWASSSYPATKLLTNQFLEELIASGYTPTEAQTAHLDELGRTDTSTASQRSRLFGSIDVPPAPLLARLGNSVPSRTRSRQTTSPRAVAQMAEAGDAEGFVMLLRHTDVGKGQTTPGTTERSPEIFIPLPAVRDWNPDFWGWPHEYVHDPQDQGKYNRPNVPVRLGATTINVTMNVNLPPRKRDVRLRSEALRSRSQIDDILRLERADGSAGVLYEAKVVGRGAADYQRWLDLCTQKPRSPRSTKRWGYYSL